MTVPAGRHAAAGDGRTAVVYPAQLLQPLCGGRNCCASGVVGGTVPGARVHDRRQRLPTPTGGEGVLETEFDSHRPVPGPPPERPRTDANPLDRRGYLLRTGGR